MAASLRLPEELDVEGESGYGLLGKEVQRRWSGKHFEAALGVYELMHEQGPHEPIENGRHTAAEKTRWIRFPGALWARDPMARLWPSARRHGSCSSSSIAAERTASQKAILLLGADSAPAGTADPLPVSIGFRNSRIPGWASASDWTTTAVLSRLPLSTTMTS